MKFLIVDVVVGAVRVGRDIAAPNLMAPDSGSSYTLFSSEQEYAVIARPAAMAVIIVFFKVFIILLFIGCFFSS